MSYAFISRLRFMISEAIGDDGLIKRLLDSKKHAEKLSDIMQKLYFIESDKSETIYVSGADVTIDFSSCTIVVLMHIGPGRDMRYIIHGYAKDSFIVYEAYTYKIGALKPVYSNGILSTDNGFSIDLQSDEPLKTLGRGQRMLTDDQYVELLDGLIRSSDKLKNVSIAVSEAWSMSKTKNLNVAAKEKILEFLTK